MTIYREGWPDQVREFVGENLEEHSRRPVYEAAITYEPKSGSLEVVANEKEAREDLASLFCSELLSSPFSQEKLKPRRYDLDVLKTEQGFPVDAEDRIDTVRVSMLRLMPMDTAEERLVLETLSGAKKTVWQMAESLGPGDPLRGSWVITQARLSIKFEPENGRGRGQTLPITRFRPCGWPSSAYGADRNRRAGLVSLIAVIILHVPVGIAMAVAGAAAYVFMTGDLSGVFSLFGTETVNMLTNKDFAVVMFFLLMGGFAGAACISADIYHVANAWIGHWKGGLAMATVLGCTGFGAISGSSIATAATMTRIALPEMEKRNYALSLCAGTLAAGGKLGSLIPPSIIMVIYAVQVQQFIVDLFLAAIMPGILSVILFVLAIRIQLFFSPELAGSGYRSDWPTTFRETKRGWAALSVIVIVMGGI